MGIGRVVRFEIPGLHSFNFVVDHALAGGASRSLRLDTQGKALGVVLLEMKIPAPTGWSCVSSGGYRQMSSRLVSREDRGPVAVFTLDRALQRNALSRALMAQSRDAIDR